jgi:hypothetical protein
MNIRTTSSKLITGHMFGDYSVHGSDVQEFKIWRSFLDDGLYIADTSASLLFLTATPLVIFITLTLSLVKESC